MNKNLEDLKFFVGLDIQKEALKQNKELEENYYANLLNHIRMGNPCPEGFRETFKDVKDLFIKEVDDDLNAFQPKKENFKSEVWKYFNPYQDQTKWLTEVLSKAKMEAIELTKAAISYGKELDYDFWKNHL